MYVPNSIVINQVANGWIVILPEHMYSQSPTLPNIFSNLKIDSEVDNARQIARAIKEEMMPDDILDRLQKEAEPVEVPVPKKIGWDSSSRTQNTFIFLDFDQVLNFLQKQVKL